MMDLSIPQSEPALSCPPFPTCRHGPALSLATFHLQQHHKQRFGTKSRVEKVQQATAVPTRCRCARTGARPPRARTRRLDSTPRWPGCCVSSGTTLAPRPHCARPWCRRRQQRPSSPPTAPGAGRWMGLRAQRVAPVHPVLLPAHPVLLPADVVLLVVVGLAPAAVVGVEVAHATGGYLAAQEHAAAVALVPVIVQLVQVGIERAPCDHKQCVKICP